VVRPQVPENTLGYEAQVAVAQVGALGVDVVDQPTGRRMGGAESVDAEAYTQAVLLNSAAPQILGDTTSYPVMAATTAGLVAVWTSGPPDRSAIGVRVIQ